MRSDLFTNASFQTDRRGLLDAWAHKDLYCVGEKTSALACAVFGRAPTLQNPPENATSLAHAIIAHTSSHTEISLLFICGEQRRDELPAILREHKVWFSI